ncbi:MAG: HD domain-containing protein [Bacteroidia bacterium]|nr:HD domain-containing protein [Bacteroidia bacterium]
MPRNRVMPIIEHPYFQRLRRIRQLGMTHLVYPGAHHTRFHHAIGAMHLMEQAIGVLQSKEYDISPEETEAVTIAILLHDIGHGPFSHALEDSIVTNIRHEELSALFMDRLNQHLDGRLHLAIDIFRNKYEKKFLHQLVSSQLDMDRLDYLSRDSFFTGVSEGVISHDRIIKMLDLANDELVIEEKGIYSIEKFIIARRLMYWQVYLHKTVVGAECLLINILKRAKELVKSGVKLFATPALMVFLMKEYSLNDFKSDPGLLDTFAQLDDSDVSASVKVWTGSDDYVLSDLCRRLIERRLFKVMLQKEPFPEAAISTARDHTLKTSKVSERDLSYYFVRGKIVNNAYQRDKDKINIRMKDGTIMDIADASDTLNIKYMSEPVEKHYLCFPK